MHILPNSKIPFAKLPLEFMIASKLNFIKKFEKVLRVKDERLKTHEPIHSRDNEADESGFVLIDEFKFPHCVFPLGNTEMNADGLKYGYNKMSQWLNLSKRNSIGVTLLVTPKWMFLAPIERPYHLETEQEIEAAKLENGVPVFLDGFSFGGVVNL
jgi:hypothetical protein